MPAARAWFRIGSVGAAECAVVEVGAVMVMSVS